MKKNDIFEIIRIGLILFAITAVSAGILAAVNSVTEPVITAKTAEKRQAAMREVLPEADSFDKIDYIAEDTSVVEAYSAGSEGYVILCEPKGYAGAVSLVVGIKPDLTVSKIDITGHSETPGLGANCVNEEFKAQFVGKTGELKVVKSNPTESQIDALSSATVTSRAVTKGVNDALKAAEELMGGEN